MNIMLDRNHYFPPLACSDKSKLIHLIEELSDSTLLTNLVKEHDESCIIQVFFIRKIFIRK